MDPQEKVAHALANTRVLLYPRQTLATFGTTTINYYFIAEIMDRVDEVRLSKGKITAERPKIITREYYQSVMLEGFGEDAFDYVNWLKSNDENLRFLEYGYQFKKQEAFQQTYKEPMKAFAEKLFNTIKEENDSFASLVVGIDNLQEISLASLMVDVIKGSIPTNAMELHNRKLFEEEQGIPKGVRDEIETAFNSVDGPSKIDALGEMLRRYGLFDHYQDRFYYLLRKFQGQR